MERIQFAVVSSALSDDPRQAPRFSRRAGFEGVQFDVFSAGFNLPDLSASGLRDFRHALSAQDQQLAGLRVDVGARGLGSSGDVDRVIARLDRAMETCAALGQRLLCVDVGPLPEAPAPERSAAKMVDPGAAGLILLPTAEEVRKATAKEAPVMPSAPADPALVAQVDGALAELGRRADRYGVTVALRSELSSSAALERAVRAAACPWFSVDYDPVAVLRDAWDVDETFSRMGALIRHVRGRDALAGTDRRTKTAVIGQGGVDWQELLANLDQAGYRGWVTVDSLELADRAGAATAGLEFLRKISG